MSTSAAFSRSSELGFPQSSLTGNNNWVVTWTFLFCFVPKTVYGPKFFELFAKVFRIFRPHRNFRRPRIFSKFSWQRCDSFGPKIVKIGAILTVFRPFEISRKVCPVWVPSKFSMRIQNRNCHISVSQNLFSDAFSGPTQRTKSKNSIDYLSHRSTACAQRSLKW